MDNRIKQEIESFDDTAAYEELMARPYTRFLKENIDSYISSINLKDAVVLELGCGISEHAHRYKDDNLMILTDITASLLKLNDPGCARAVADAQILPFKSNSCDFAIFLGGLKDGSDQ